MALTFLYQDKRNGRFLIKIAHHILATAVLENYEIFIECYRSPVRVVRQVYASQFVINSVFF